MSLNDGIHQWDIVVHDCLNTCAPTLQFCSVCAAEMVVSEVNFRTGLTWSDRRAPVTKRAAAFWTRRFKLELLVTNPNPNPNLNVTWSGLPTKSNGFFSGPCATFPPNYMKIGMAQFARCVILLTKQTNADENNVLGGGNYNTMFSIDFSAEWEKEIQPAYYSFNSLLWLV